MDAGELSIHAAFLIASEPPQRQREILQMPRELRRKTVREIRLRDELPRPSEARRLARETGMSVADNTGVYVVPKDHYFMMGDNRDNSTDSRFPSVRFVPKENFVGRAEFLFFSVDGQAWEIWKWFSTVRGERLFTGIE